MPPEFTAVIPTLRDSPYLRAAVASALAQRVGLEVLVVHDASAGEPPPAPGQPHVTVLRSGGGGPGAARNTGLAHAAAPLVAFLDDDDVWLPGHLEQAAALLRAEPAAPLVAGDAYLLEDDTSHGPAAVPEDPSRLPRFAGDPPADSLALRDLLLRNRVLTPTVVVARDRLALDERFRTDLAVMEDYELWLRIARRTPLVFDSIPTTVVRRRRGSASADWRAMAEGSLRVLQPYLDSGEARRLLTRRELERRLGGVWHDLAYACLVADDLAGARNAARQTLRHLPMHLKTYMYVLASALPGPLRRALFARGRSIREQGGS